MPNESSFELSPLSSICLLNGYQPNSDRLKSYQIQKIRRRLKLLEHYLNNYSLCQLKWLERRTNGFRGIVFAFNHGLISSIVPNKLSSKRISSIEMTDNGALIAFVEPFIVMVEFDDTYSGWKLKFKNNYRLKHLEQLGGHNNGRGMAKRNIAICESLHLALLWSNRMPHRPISKLLPIIPTTKQLEQQMEKNLSLLAFDDFRLIEFDHSINGEILQADFVANDRGKFGVLHKQKTSVYNLTYSLFESIEHDGNNDVPPVDGCPIKLLFEIGIPLEKLCFSAEFTRLQDKILLLCDDESVMLFNIEQNVLYALHSSKPICHMAMYPLDSLFVTCDPNGSISFYDIAFQNIIHRTSMSNECHPNSNMSVKQLQFLSADKLVVLMVENRRQDSSIDTIGHHHMATTCCCCMKVYNIPY
ncbi:hypothetical protein BLA29_005108, partial [Euroglyphus maynei]